MADTTLTADIIAKEALAILDNELDVLGTFHRAYEDEFSEKVNGYRVGTSINIRRPADPQVRSGAVIASYPDVIEGKVSLTVDQQIGTQFDFSSSDLTLKIEDLSERVIKPAMSNIINYMVSDCLTVMYQGVYNWVGTPGQTINSFADFAKGPERLDMMSVPMANRNAVLHPNDHWALLGSQTGLYIQGPAGSAYREGSLGKIGGVETRMSQVVPTFTTGARGGTPLVNGASQNVTYDTAKNTWTQSLVIDGASNSITGWAKAGDVFTLAGVYMVNQKTKATTDVLQQFVVTADADSSGAGAVTLTISPPIISAAGQHHRTVSAAPADNAALTFVGSAATGYNQNMVYHKNTMALAVVPMIMPQGTNNGSRQSMKGISVRVIPTYDGTNDVSQWRLDMLYGRKVIDPRLAARVSGTS
jgi:hypothetical protein